jgi:hypothetical protein
MKNRLLFSVSKVSKVSKVSNPSIDSVSEVSIPKNRYRLTALGTSHTNFDSEWEIVNVAKQIESYNKSHTTFVVKFGVQKQINIF